MASALVSKIISPRPIVVIFGATGTGKSKLAIEVAKKFNGEVISVDSMQVYTGLNIITNKVTEQEQSGVPHHLLNFVNPLFGITAIDFRNRALKIMDEIAAREKMAVLVGGTMYYLESLLFDILLPEAMSEGSSYSYDAGFDQLKKNELEELSVEELHRLVVEVDPEMAEVLHPGDRRKVLRCLKVFEKSGRKLSSLLKSQRSQPGGSDLGGPFRFPSAILLWIQCEKEVLDRRLDDRVDKMLEDGLVEELMDFHRDYNRRRMEKNEAPDYTRGIFQAIGFKEFHEYLILDEEKRNSEEGEKQFGICVENLKLVTKRYARKQTKWIRNRFLKRGSGKIPPIYPLDATNLEHWDEKVSGTASDIIEAVMGGRKPACEPIPELTVEEDVRTVYKCEVCNLFLKGRRQYDAHVEGNKHRRAAKRKKTEERSEGVEQNC